MTVTIVVHLTVKDVDAFKSAAKALKAANSEYNANASSPVSKYDFYLESNTSSTIIEVYPDGDAILQWTSSDQYKAAIGPLFEHADLATVDFFGELGPASKLLDAIPCPCRAFTAVEF
jgi:hypothetical protein